MTPHKAARTAILLVALSALACGNDKPKPGAGSASAAVSASAPPSDSAAPEPSGSAPAGSASAAAEKPKVIRRNGTIGEFFNLTRGLDLKDDQKEKLDKIDEELYSEIKEDEDVKNALKEFGTALIDGVKAGKVDTAKLTPQYAPLEKAAKDRHDAEAKALNQLHDILDATQRKALVEALRKRHPTEAAKKAAQAPKPATAPKPLSPAKPGQPAKPAAPLKPPPPPKPPAPPVNPTVERMKRRVQRVGSLLGLDEAQQKRVEPILARYDTDAINKTHRAQLDKRIQALINAFEKDTFDAGQLDLGKGPRARMENRVAFITALLMIIKADQREKLARVIERPGARRWGGAVAGEAGPADDE